ncbi:MAG: hypothetical protein ACLUE2_02720 [Bacteroides cellulosilyticus]
MTPRREQAPQYRNTCGNTTVMDENQRRFESNKSAEKKALESYRRKSPTDNSEEWQINAIKNNMCRDFDLGCMESGTASKSLHADAGSLSVKKNLGTSSSTTKMSVMAITTEDIKRASTNNLPADQRLPGH